MFMLLLVWVFLSKFASGAEIGCKMVQAEDGLVGYCCLFPKKAVKIGEFPFREFPAFEPSPGSTAGPFRKQNAIRKRITTTERPGRTTTANYSVKNPFKHYDSEDEKRNSTVPHESHEKNASEIVIGNRNNINTPITCTEGHKQTKTGNCEEVFS